MAKTVRVAACHVFPVFLSSAATTQKAISLIHTASSHGVSLVVFPESFIPAFPIWSALLPPTVNHDFFKRMVQESIFVDGPEIQSIRDAAKQLSMTVSIGISEKVHYSSATLFNTNLIISPDGEIIVHHRKLCPTFFEKLTWSPGDGFGLKVAEMPWGKLGALICGENTNPLARYALMAQGEQVHISSWPAIWPTREVEKPKSALGSDMVDGGQESMAKSSKGANYDNVAANRMRAAAHCFEAKCFGILCAGTLGERAIDELVAVSGGSGSVLSSLKHSSRGATMFLDPTGTLLPGFIIDPKTGEKQTVDMLQHEEGILYADLDMADCVEGKQYHDVVGGYQRFDVFDLKVDRRRKDPITFINDGNN